jgi:hypothetical protein
MVVAVELDSKDSDQAASLRTTDCFRLHSHLDSQARIQLRHEMADRSEAFEEREVDGNSLAHAAGIDSHVSVPIHIALEGVGRRPS